MITPTRISTLHTTSQPLTRTRRTSTQHYSNQTNKSQEHERQASRSKGAHRCITIRGWRPAFGRPQPALRAVDLAHGLAKIVSGWSGC